jgi:hypothetical protein
MTLNDNHPRVPRIIAADGDAHGHAALLLVESLIHGLIERSVLTVEQSVEIIEAAVDVQTDVAREADGAGARMWQAHSLLSSMSATLQLDRDDVPGGESTADR